MVGVLLVLLCLGWVVYVMTMTTLEIRFVGRSIARSPNDPVYTIENICENGIFIQKNEEIPIM